MVLVAGGKCPIGASVSHEEIHKEQVAPFLIAKTPVSNEEYKRFIDEAKHSAPEFNSVGNKEHLWTGRTFPPEIAEQPVVNVSWHDAAAYCGWLAKKTGKAFRLPTEEEWEFAARGNQKRAYPWGNDISKEKAWYKAKWAGPKTMQPADYGTPNPYGLLGMSGNVWQWVDDWFVPVFNGRPVPEELKMFKVVRGGSWANGEEFLRVDYRNFHQPDFKDFFVGFRVAMTAPPGMVPPPEVEQPKKGQKR